MALRRLFSWAGGRAVLRFTFQRARAQGQQLLSISNLFLTGVSAISRTGI